MSAASATAAGLAQASAQEAGPIEIQSIDASGFPLIRAVVSGPTIEGDPDGAFVVVEDGTEVEADVLRLRTDELNVVVAVDVSGSMEGEPLAQAKAAVGELLANLPADVPVSIVSFGQSAVVSHPFSTDRASIQAACRPSRETPRTPTSHRACSPSPEGEGRSSSEAR